MSINYVIQFHEFINCKSFIALINSSLSVIDTFTLIENVRIDYEKKGKNLIFNSSLIWCKKRKERREWKIV